MDNILKDEAEIVQAASGQTDVAEVTQQKRSSSGREGSAAKTGRSSRYSSVSHTCLWAEADMEALKQLHDEHGNGWKQLCQHFDFRGRTPSSATELAACSLRTVLGFVSLTNHCREVCNL